MNIIIFSFGENVKMIEHFRDVFFGSEQKEENFIMNFLNEFYNFLDDNKIKNKKNIEIIKEFLYWINKSFLKEKFFLVEKKKKTEKEIASLEMLEELISKKRKSNENF